MKHPLEKHLLCAIASLWLTVPLLAQEPIVLQPHDTITFCGDCGPLDKLVGSYLAVCQPQQYSVQAIPGGRITDIPETPAGQAKDGPNAGDMVLLTKPDVVVLCYGTRSAELSKSNPDLLERYRQNLVKAIQRLKAGGVRLVILTSPTASDPDVMKAMGLTITYEDFTNTLVDLNKVTMEVAASEKTGYAELMTPMADTMKKAKAALGPTYAMTGPDFVYPTNNSGPILAYAMLKAFKCDGNIGEITLDMSSGTATGTDGQKVVSADKGKVEIESTRYPFCFGQDPGDPKDLKSIASVIPFTPFNEELNRYILKVKNVPDGKWKVTWGDQSKDFTAAQLKEGINLAAEFIVNPFTMPVQKAFYGMLDREVYLGGVVGPLTFEVRRIEVADPTAKNACKNLIDGINTGWGMIKAVKPPTPLRYVITIIPATS